MTTRVCALTLNIQYNFHLTLFNVFRDQINAIPTQRFLLYPWFVMMLIRRMLPDTHVPPRGCADSSVFGHLVDPTYVWRGKLPPAPQQQQPPPPPQQYPASAAQVIELAYIPEVRLRRRVEDHLSRQPTPIRQGIVDNAYGLQEQRDEEGVDEEAVEAIVWQVLNPSSPPAVAVTSVVVVSSGHVMGSFEFWKTNAS